MLIFRLSEAAPCAHHKEETSVIPLVPFVYSFLCCYIMQYLSQCGHVQKTEQTESTALFQQSWGSGYMKNTTAGYWNVL